MDYEDPDDEQLKREIWEEVERARAEREAREKEERRKRAAASRRAKPDPVGPEFIDDSEASEKLLAQRKKREEDRKRLAELKRQRLAQQQAAQPDSGIEIAVATSPKPNPPVATRSAARPTQPTSQRTQETVPVTIPTSRPNPSVSTSFSPSPSPSPSTGEDEDWKEAYHKLKQKLEAEYAGRKRMEQVLQQYESTINSLMAEQTDGGDSDQLRQENSELQAELDAKNSELQALSEMHDSLLSNHRELNKKCSQFSQREQELQQRIQQLQNQVSDLRSASPTQSDSSVSAQAEKLAEFRAASAKQTQVLKLKCAKYEAKIEALQSELNARIIENDKLTQISDTLVVMLEGVDEQ